MADTLGEIKQAIVDVNIMIGRYLDENGQPKYANGTEESAVYNALLQMKSKLEYRQRRLMGVPTEKLPIEAMVEKAKHPYIAGVDLDAADVARGQVRDKTEAYDRKRDEEKSSIAREKERLIAGRPHVPAETARSGGASPMHVQPMPLDSYQEKAQETAIYPGQKSPLGLLYCSLKLTGEAGEFSDKIGKAIRDEQMARITSHVPGGGVMAYLSPLTDDKRLALALELGDVLWYVANLAGELGFTLEEIAKQNLGKLAARKLKNTLRGSGDDR